MDFCARTVLILEIPIAALIISLGLTLKQGAETLFVSDAINFERQEPWGYWALRYLVWHAATFGIVYFKLRAFPPKIQWVAWFNLMALLLCIWTGFKQIDDAGYFGSWRQYSHWVMSAVVFFLFAIETPALWWPSRDVGVAYVVLSILYILAFLAAENGLVPDTGIPYIGTHIEIPLEYVILGSHLLIVWSRYEVIQEEGFKSGPCSCCCPGLDTASKDVELLWANQE